MAAGMNMHDVCINDDGFKVEGAAEVFDINQGLNWRGRRLGISGLHVIERTPLMLATMHGDISVLRQILNSPGVDVNRSSATDNLTALDCCFVYRPHESIYYTLQASNARCQRPNDPGGFGYWSSNRNEVIVEHDPDVSGWANETEHFMMHKYKMRPCPWGDLCPGFQMCPYLHPDDIFRRRDFREQKYYSSFCWNQGPCPYGSDCRFAHGETERLFHPECFRTLRCNLLMLCPTTACCYAHNPLEQRGGQVLDWAYPPAPPPPPPPPPPIRSMPQFGHDYRPQFLNNIVVNPPVCSRPPYVPQQYNASLRLPPHAFVHGLIRAGTTSQVMNNQSQNLIHQIIPRPANSAFTLAAGPSSSSHNQGNPGGVLEPSTQTARHDRVQVVDRHYDASQVMNNPVANPHDDDAGLCLPSDPFGMEQSEQDHHKN